MPAPDPDFIVVPTIPPVSVALEPANNMFNSLLLLAKGGELSGLDEWVARTVAVLAPEQLHDTRVALIGLHYAVAPDQSWPSFPAYIRHLAAQDPFALRDRVFDVYAKIYKDRCGEDPFPAGPADEQVNVAALLEDVDAFLEFLARGFGVDFLDTEIETEAHTYLNDPPAMQAFVVSHLKSLWEDLLSVEWDRVLPMLQASVDAFQQLDLGGKSKLEAAKLVLGREPEEKWISALEKAERVIFVPSAHVGPYLSKLWSDGTLWLMFGARIPEGVQVDAPDLSRAEILVRLNALADDTRLRILRLISQKGEQRSQDIMTQLELSQSAVSRHLKQLSATGYLDERRCEGAKCYVLNHKRIEDTLGAISVFLLGK